MRVTTVGGIPGELGWKDGRGSVQSLKVMVQKLSFSALAADSSGNLYVADTYSHRIRKVSGDGTVSTIAGSGVFGYLDGKAEETKFGNCYGIAVGEDGTVYASDTSNHVIRVVKDGFVSTLAGKPKEKGMKD